MVLCLGVRCDIIYPLPSVAGGQIPGQQQGQPPVTHNVNEKCETLGRNQDIWWQLEFTCSHVLGTFCVPDFDSRVWGELILIILIVTLDYRYNH